MNNNTNDTIRIVPVIDDNEPCREEIKLPAQFIEDRKQNRIRALQGISRFLNHTINESITRVEFTNGVSNGLQGLKTELEKALEYCNQHINS